MTQQEAQEEIIRRFFPEGLPDSSSVTERDVKQGIEHVEDSMRELGAQPSPEEPGCTERVLRFKHTF